MSVEIQLESPVICLPVPARWAFVVAEGQRLRVRCPVGAPVVALADGIVTERDALIVLDTKLRSLGGRRQESSSLSVAYSGIGNIDTVLGPGWAGRAVSMGTVIGIANDPAGLTLQHVDLAEASHTELYHALVGAADPVLLASFHPPSASIQVSSSRRIRRKKSLRPTGGVSPRPANIEQIDEPVEPSDRADGDVELDPKLVADEGSVPSQPDEDPQQSGSGASCDDTAAPPTDDDSPPAPESDPPQQERGHRLAARRARPRKQRRKIEP